MATLIRRRGVTAIVQPPPADTGGGTPDTTKLPLGANLSNGNFLLSQAEINFIITKNFRGPIILNGWDFNARDQLHAAGVLTCMYVDLTSTRQDGGNVGGNGPCAIAYEQADPSWFFTRGGNRYPEVGYSGQWWMNPLSGWKAEWKSSALARVTGTNWNGIFSDNEMPRSTSDYYGLVPNDQGVNLTTHQAAQLALVQDSGAAMRAVGKFLMPNIADPVEDGDTWLKFSIPGGGGFLEMGFSYGTDENGSYHDQSKIKAQMDLMGQTGTSNTGIAMLHGWNVGPKKGVFAKAAFEIGGGGLFGAYFGGDDTYSQSPAVWYQDEFSINLGAPTGAYVQTGAWGFSRRFAGGWAAANLANEGSASVTITVPAGLHTWNGGSAPSSVTLPPHTGAIYKN